MVQEWVILSFSQNKIVSIARFEGINFSLQRMIFPKSIKVDERYIAESKPLREKTNVINFTFNGNVIGN